MRNFVQFAGRGPPLRDHRRSSRSVPRSSPGRAVCSSPIIAGESRSSKICSSPIIAGESGEEMSIKWKSRLFVSKKDDRSMNPRLTSTPTALDPRSTVPRTLSLDPNHDCMNIAPTTEKVSYLSCSWGDVHAMVGIEGQGSFSDISGPIFRKSQKFVNILCGNNAPWRVEERSGTC